MPHHTEKHNGLKLPQKLQQELGIDRNASGGRKERHGASTDRKHLRKTERQQKKSAKASSIRERFQCASNASIFDEETRSSSSDDGLSPEVRSKIKSEKQNPRLQRLYRSASKLKSTLKKPVRTSPSPESTVDGRDVSPQLVLDANSKSFKDHAAQDDAEVDALEKKLGVKSKKLPRSFEQDGLGDLLEGLESEDEGKKRKRDGMEWFQYKRMRVEDEADDARDDENELEDHDPESDFSGASDSGRAKPEDSERSAQHPDEDKSGRRSKQKENPYTAPVQLGSKKKNYVPPFRRQTPSTDAQSLERLRRQMQGYLNKLSEANLVTILSEIEKLYASHPRQDVTSTLINLLLALHCDRSALQSTFVILHAAFVAAVYKIIGPDFGAEMVSRTVERFDQFYESASGKEEINLLSLLAHLYTFHVIGSKLIYYFIRLFLEQLNEPNAELLLRIVRDVGPQLRQDDPSAMKDIVQLAQNSAVKLAASGQDTSVRTKFMLDSITELKNNKTRAAATVNGVAVDHITHLRKTLGSLNTRNIRASEPLQIGREDIKNSEKQGKWWLVGASWRGSTTNRELSDETLNSPLILDDNMNNESQEADLLALACQYRMNTSVRRSIFVSVMSATDFQDAHLRLLKLRLKRSQEPEIAKVLMRCAGAEATYNRYYTLIASKLCSDKKMKMAFQFSLWDFFKRMGEEEREESDDEDEADNVELTEIVNLAKMFAALVVDGALNITLLKVLNLAILKEQSKMFAELLLVEVILQTHEDRRSVAADELKKIFMKVADAPQLISALDYFIRKVVRRTDLGKSKEEGTHIANGCRVAVKALQAATVAVSRQD
jgi:nucleolar MIF4G domain-containing protein 1